MDIIHCTVCNAEKRIKKTTKKTNRVEHLFECGHKLVELSVYDSAKAYELLGTKKKGLDNFFPGLVT